MKIGTQIAYKPTHADTLEHPDVEFGFVTGLTKGEIVFCRFYRDLITLELRTKANSEGVNISDLIETNFTNQAYIDRWLKENY